MAAFHGLSYPVPLGIAYLLLFGWLGGILWDKSTQG